MIPDRQTSQERNIRNGLAESVLDEIKQLDGLKTLSISSNWYELFSEADLDCELIVIDDQVNIFR